MWAIMLLALVATPASAQSLLSSPPTSFGGPYETPVVIGPQAGLACAPGACDAKIYTGTVAATLSPSYGTSDSTQIAAAIAAAASGSAVVLTPGLYKIGTALQLKTGVSIQCQYGAILQATGAPTSGTIPSLTSPYSTSGNISNAIFQTTGTAANNLTISGCTLDGGQYGGPGVYSGAIELDTYSSNVTINYNTFQNWTNSQDLQLYEAQNIYFQRNLLQNGYQGVSWKTNSGDTAISNIFFTDNIIKNFGRFGIESNISSTLTNAHADRNQISNTYCEAVSWVGEFQSGTVSGNIIGPMPSTGQYGCNPSGVEMGNNSTNASYNITSQYNLISSATVGHTIGDAPGVAILGNTYTSVTAPFSTDYGFNGTQWIGLNTINGVPVNGWVGQTQYSSTQPTLFQPSPVPQ